MKELKVGNWLHLMSEKYAYVRHDSAPHKDLDFWLEDMETKMASEELGKDMASVNALLKKHQLHEADMMAHEVPKDRFQIALFNYCVLSFASEIVNLLIVFAAHEARDIGYKLDTITFPIIANTIETHDSR